MIYTYSPDWLLVGREKIKRNAPTASQYSQGKIEDTVKAEEGEVKNNFIRFDIYRQTSLTVIIVYTTLCHKVNQSHSPCQVLSTEACCGLFNPSAPFGYQWALGEKQKVVAEHLQLGRIAFWLRFDAAIPTKHDRSFAKTTVT